MTILFLIPGLFGPAIALVLLGIFGEGRTGLAIGLLVTAVGLNSAIFCGHQVNHIDIAPSHAGTLMGITNGCANIFSIVGPLLVQYVVTDEVSFSRYKCFCKYSTSYFCNLMVSTEASW